ncbi:MAG: SPOR domain-containing protein [Spirochaetaceae bacterium]|nr:SPOR domain-containing protein [Spirochaetaceae bacterium]
MRAGRRTANEPRSVFLFLALFSCLFALFAAKDLAAAPVAPVGAPPAAPLPAVPAPPSAVQVPSPAATPSAPAASAPPASANLEAFRAELRAALSRRDFPALLAARAEALSPADAAALLREFAPLAGDPASSKALLLRGAELHLLLGKPAEAAALFEAAAFKPGLPRDSLLLLRTARMRLAAGEAERAAAMADIILKEGPVEAVALQARLVLAWSALLGGDPASASATAQALLSDGGLLAASGARGSPARREALFVAWAAAPAAQAGERAKVLAAEFPDSPEALIAKGESAALSLAPLPHWFLTGLLAKTPATRPSPGSAVPGFVPPATAPAATPAPPQAVVAVPQSLAASPSPAASPSAAAPGAVTPSPSGTVSAAEPTAPAIKRFQVGVFSKSDNAARLVAELAAKGFSAKSEKRVSGGKELLVVVVDGLLRPAKGGEADNLLLRLKDAGYEAYPLF